MFGPTAPAVRLPHRSLLVLAVAAALAGPAFAQDPPPKDEGPVELEAVSVSAERREENILEVPVSVSTVSGEALDAINSAGEDIRALSGRLPSLYIEGSFGRTFPRFFVRGLGNTDFDLNASQPVSLVMDDVVLENPILKGFPIFDLDQVELLRGPQGSLFGRNTTAGLVKLDSARPTKELDGYGQLNIGSRGMVNFEGAVGGGFGDGGVSARVSALANHRDDWVDNLGTSGDDELEGYDEFAARAQLLIEPSDSFSALLNAHVRSLDGTARLFRAGIIERGSNDFVDGYDRDVVALDGRNEQELDAWGANARLRWDFGPVTLHSITGYETVEVYSRGDIDGGSIYDFPPDAFESLFPSESADGMPDHSQFTQEFRLESNDDDDGWDWQVGAYWFDEEITVESFSYDGFGGPENGYAVQEQRNKAWALFGSAQVDISDAFTLRGGLRWTHDEKDFVAQRFSSPFGFAGIGPAGPLYANPSDTNLSWDLAATWHTSEHVNFYARAATGFRAPSIQGRILFAFTNTPELSVADSEEVLSFEAGIKAELFDRRARLSFGLFHYTVDGQQLIAVGGAFNTAILLNADKSVGQGFEFDVQAYLHDNFLVTWGMSYNDTEIHDDELAVAPCGSLCTVLDPAGPVPGTVLIDGNPLPQAPKWISNVTARWGIPVGQGEFFVYTDWAYRSEVNFFLYESEEYRGKSLLEGGLRVGYNWHYGDYEVALFGRNITDREAIVGGIDFNNLTGFVNEPRTWGLEFTGRF